MTARPALLLARRSLASARRQWVGQVTGGLVFPLITAAVLVPTFQGATSLPGFPQVESFLDFILAGVLVMGVMFNAVDVADELADDIQSGFLDRLIVSPAPRTALLFGRLGGVIVLASLQALVIVAVLTAFGASVKGGAAAIATIMLVCVGLAAASGGVASMLALRAGTAGAVAAFAPFFFLVQFASSAFFPRDLMEGWFRVLATLNPLSWLVEDLRYLVIVGFRLDKAVQALAIVGVVAACGITSCVVTLHRLGRR